jgi:hypothetical protein
MRPLLAVLLLGCLGGAPVHAAEPSRASAWQLERYRAALGGLLLDERCRVLPEPARRELAWRVARIEEGLRPEWGAAALDAAAATAAAAPEPDCAAALVEAERALATAREFSILLRGDDYSPEALRLADGTRLARLLLTQRVDDRCRAIGERRSAFDADVGALRARLAADGGAHMLDQLDAFADNLAAELNNDEPAISCEEFAGPGLERMLAEARRAAGW